MPGVLTEIGASRLQTAERQLRRQVAQRAFQNLSSEIDGPGEIVVRDIHPGLDLDTTSTNGWSTSDQAWFQDLSGGTTDGWNDVYQIDHSGQAENKVVGLLLFRNQTKSTTLSEWRIQNNTDGSGGVRDRFQVEGLNSEEDATGVLVDPEMHIYGQNRDALLQAYSVGAPQDGEQWVIEGAVGEVAGQNVQAPDTPILNQNGEPNDQSLATDGGEVSWTADVEGLEIDCSLPLAGRKVA